MADASDSDPDFTVEEDSTSPILRRRPAAAASTFVARKSPRNLSRNDEKKPPAETALPTLLKAINPRLKSVKEKLRSRSYDSHISLRIIHAALTLQKEHLEAQGKVGQARKLPSPAVRKRVCSLLGVSNQTYQQVVSAYFAEKKEYSTGKRGNFDQKSTRIPNTQVVKVAVREFVRNCRKDRQRVTARQVLDFLHEQGHIHVQKEGDIYEKKALESAYRNVRLFLQKNDYRRGPRTGNIVLSNNHKALLHQYLKRFFANRALPPESRKREVYLDESYIHEHYNRYNDSIWDPFDDEDVQVGKAKNKGRRYCFIAAIRGVCPLGQEQAGQEKAGLVPGSLWKFCPQKKGDSTGDYHKVFHSGNFVDWWKRQLLPNLLTPSVIYLDNAKYHKTYDSTVPKAYKLKKSELQSYLESVGVEFDPTDTRPLLYKRTKSYIENNCKYEIVKLAEEKGHEVVFTAPCYSDLQPIELVWALVKGRVGRVHTAATTLDMVLDRLDKEFNRLFEDSGAESIRKMIEKCASKCKELYDEAQLDEEAGDGDSVDSDDISEQSSQEDTESADGGDASHSDSEDSREDDERCVGV